MVATPIGNLRDITLRALDVLAAADLVLAEDTRVAGKLLSAYGLSAKLERYDEHAAERTRPKAMAALAEGKRVALISDCNATLTDEEHSAALNTFATFFGDVAQTQEAIAMIRRAPSSHLSVADGRFEAAICAKST